MAEILELQDEIPDTPDEDKGSHYSFSLCYNSYRSYFGCMPRL